MKDTQGRTFRLSEHKGQVLLINFWATWCPPCRTEMPELIKMQREYGNRGLQIIGITYPPEKLFVVARFARRVKVNYPLILGTKATKLLFTSSETLPMTVVIDGEGAVRYVIEGILLPEEFQEKVEPLLSADFRQHLTQAKAITIGKHHRVQTATIAVGTEGYQPASIELRRGVPARLTFVRKTATTCGTEIIISEYGINRPLPLEEPVVVTFTPDRSGTFKFTCGMDMFRGALIVR